MSMHYIDSEVFDYNGQFHTILVDMTVAPVIVSADLGNRGIN